MSVGRPSNLLKDFLKEMGLEEKERYIRFTQPTKRRANESGIRKKSYTRDQETWSVAERCGIHIHNRPRGAPTTSLEGGPVETQNRGINMMDFVFWAIGFSVMFLRYRSEH